MEAAIHIGAEKQAVKRLMRGITDILDSNTCDAVKLSALDVLKSACQVTGTLVQNCTFSGLSETPAKQKKERT